MADYLLAGQVYPPGKANDFQAGARTFKLDLPDMPGDDSAIEEADQYIKQTLAKAGKDKVVNATLWHGSCVVKNFQ